MAFKLSKGTIVYYDLTGWGKAADEVTNKFEGVNSFSGVTVSRESISEIDLETGDQVKAAGNTSVDALEISVRIPDGDTLFETFYAAMDGDNQQTLKAVIAGKTFLFNTVITNVGLPVEESGFMHTTISFEVSGKPTLVKA
ncbi:hypothetical protein [Vibrio diabolicus]|uniref:hypothetical protein n=1 Tax=Vibrio diabolicus TaxID=50719 RepID=UPI0038CD1012